MTGWTPFADVFAALPLPTLAIGKDERIIALNPAAEALVGAGAPGRHFVTVLRQPTLVEAVEGCMADGKARRSRYAATQNGVDQAYDVTLKQIANTQTLILSFQDITQMAQAGQMRRDFVANVTHELRTPLTSLIGFIETLRGHARDDAAARDRFLGIMEDEAGRMNRLIGDLLSLSRVESDVRVRPKTHVDLSKVLQTTLRNLNPLAVENDIVLTPAFDDVPVRIMGDADQLIQVFTNLIENAVKYGGSGKTVEVSMQTHLHDPSLRGPSVRVVVTDQGTGIDPIHIPRLTERFYRADNHRSRALGGTGLGLAITKHIVNRHRGRLKITSEMGQGSAFSVILPLDPPLD
jgi:two-component system phosphate regulon sensor histidine kinase PhoR